MNIRKLQADGVYTAEEIRKCMTADEWREAEKVLAGRAWMQGGQKVWSGEAVKTALRREAIRKGVRDGID